MATSASNFTLFICGLALIRALVTKSVAAIPALVGPPIKNASIPLLVMLPTASLDISPSSYSAFSTTAVTPVSSINSVNPSFKNTSVISPTRFTASPR